MSRRASRRPAGDDRLAITHGAVDPTRWSSGCGGNRCDRTGAINRHRNATMPLADGTWSATVAMPGNDLQRRKLAGPGHSCRRSEATAGSPCAIRIGGHHPSECRCCCQLRSMFPVGSERRASWPMREAAGARAPCRLEGRGGSGCPAIPGCTGRGTAPWNRQGRDGCDLARMPEMKCPASKRGPVLDRPPQSLIQFVSQMASQMYAYKVLLSLALRPAPSTL